MSDASGKWVQLFAIEDDGAHPSRGLRRGIQRAVQQPPATIIANRILRGTSNGSMIGGSVHRSDLRGLGSLLGTTPTSRRVA